MICCSRQKSRCIDRVLRRTSLHAPGLRRKSLGHSQDLLPWALCLIFTFRLLSCGRDRRRHWSRTERRQKVSDAKSTKSVRSALQKTVGRVSRRRDLFLFGLTNFFSQPQVWDQKNLWMWRWRISKRLRPNDRWLTKINFWRTAWRSLLTKFFADENVLL